MQGAEDHHEKIKEGIMRATFIFTITDRVGGCGEAKFGNRDIYKHPKTK